MTAPFAALQRIAADKPPAWRCWVEAHMGDATAGEWRLIGLEASDRAYEALCPDPLLDAATSKRHQPIRRSKQSTTVRVDTVPVLSDDLLKNISPQVYVEALTGETVPASGWLSCPLPDHEDRTPSFQVLSSHWRCFGCNRGGGIIDLAAALYGITPRGRAYWELRDLIVQALPSVMGKIS